MKKKKILFLIWSFTAGGGAEKILANIVNNLDYKKYDISVLEFIGFDIKKESINNNVRLLKPILYNGGNILNRIKNKIVKYLVYRNPWIVYKFFIREKYDIQVAFNYMIPSFIISNSKGKKYVWVHSSIEDLNYKDLSGNGYNKIKFKYKLQQESFMKMDKIIAISNKTYESIVDLYPETTSKLEKIYNGYDFGNIYDQSNLRVENIKEDGKYTLIAIGRLVKQKNFIFLIDVMKKLKDMGVKYNLFILGNGSEQNRIEKKIIDNKLEDNIHLLGFVGNPYPYLKQSDLFCLTSIAEGFPTVLIESLALGCPFISTNVAGADELSDNGRCGIVVDNLDDYVLAIKKILENNEMRNDMSKNGINKVKNYSVTRQIVEVERLFDLN